MNRPVIPYSLQVTLSLMGGDKKRHAEVVGNIIAKLGSDVTEFIQGYDPSDLPFVIAAMQIVSNGIMPILGEGGQGIVRNLVNNTQTVAMDVETFRKLMVEEESK